MGAEMTNTRIEVTRRYKLTDFPPTPVADFQMVPFEAVVQFVNGRFDSLRLLGRVIRDGEVTREPVTHTYYGEIGRGLPEWARPLIEGENPQ